MWVRGDYQEAEGGGESGTGGVCTGKSTYCMWGNEVSNSNIMNILQISIESGGDLCDFVLETNGR